MQENLREKVAVKLLLLNWYQFFGNQNIRDLAFFIALCYA